MIVLTIVVVICELLIRSGVHGTKGRGMITNAAFGECINGMGAYPVGRESTVGKQEVRHNETATMKS